VPGFSPELIADIANTTLETYLDRGEVFKQNIQDKPMLDAFNASAGQFPGGKEKVSFAVSSGQGGQALQGFTGDDQVTYGNPVGVKRASFPWKEHHIGLTITMTELKNDGIDIDETGPTQKASEMSEREMQALANRMDEKNEMLGEDYTVSLDRLIHGDGSSDTKALAGIASLILEVPNAGTTGNVSRVANPWWQNRAATAAYGLAGGQGAITSNVANGGALIEFLDKEYRQLNRYSGGSAKRRNFAGSDFIDAYKKELRANGNYTLNGWRGKKPDGSMDDPAHGGIDIVYDPTLDDLGLAKRMYSIDMSKRGVRLMYMDGQKMKKHNPSRPHDRYVIYKGITMTGLLIAKRLRSSGVYDIA
jgi:hypothetical protein